MSDHSRDVTDAQFDDAVILGSHSRLVVVDFWAPWCGPCRTLKPILETIASDFSGRFLLAKVNADDNPASCRAHGVRGLPTVKAFWQGEVVDEFTGALSEGYVRDFISRNLPSPAADLLHEAQTLRRQGATDAAMQRIEEALRLDPASDPARVEKAEILFARGEVDAAHAIMEKLRGDILDYEHTHQIKSRIELARDASLVAPRVELERQISAEPSNLHAIFGLALHDAKEEHYARALERLLSIIQINPRFESGAARRTMITIFEILGPGNDLVAQYRRGLAAALN